jgi:hypothetical protein
LLAKGVSLGENVYCKSIRHLPYVALAGA